MEMVGNILEPFVLTLLPEVHALDGRIQELSAIEQRAYSNSQHRSAG
jgi:hypothetical protein